MNRISFYVTNCSTIEENLLNNKMKHTSNNNNKCSVSWVGKQCEPHEIENSFKKRPAVFYRKCFYGALTLEVGSYVLVSNMDNPDPDSVSGSDIARIEYMYETLFDDRKDDAYRAIVQWYSRPEALPTKIINDENYIFDFNNEIIEDSRFSPDISIETINGLCRVEIVKPETIASDAIRKIKSKFPVFIARYRLSHTPGTKKMHLESLILDKANRVQINHVNDIPNTPQRKLNRLKSIEFIDVDRFEDQRIAESKTCVEQGKWVIKTVIDADYSYKNKLDSVTEGMCDVGISDDIKMTSSKIKIVQNAKRKTHSFRKNLNASFHYESPTSSDAEVLNYSIVKDDTNSEPAMKIKLRLSEHQKSMGETPTRRSNRKRSTYEENATTDNETSPRKNRKTDSHDYETQTTPSLRLRRKSILKTPNHKELATPGTPKRNIQLSNIVEEFSNEGRISKRIDTTPTKNNPIVEMLETPRSRKRASLLGTYKSTPNSSTKLKLIRSGAIKPNIHTRDFPVDVPLNDQLAIVRERLHVSAIPQSLPCREKEYNEIHSFLEGKIIDRCSGCMYISGVPGTGKTATTSAVIHALQSQTEEEIPKFEFVEINGMRLTEPRQAYVHIYRQLTGKTLAWEQAYNLLDKRFTTKAPRRVTTVLLVDELDILCNKRQDVVYNLLNWPTAATAHLVVITIANTMDLPERLLMGKISSRLGLTRLTFQPYNFRQLQEIVMTRLIGMSSFDSDAVQLVARKVAAVSGDARRALDICRRAAELADSYSRASGKHVNVSMVHVQQALGEMIASAKVQIIKSCSRMEQLFLQAVTAEVARTGIEECSFLGVYLQFESLAAFAGIAVPNPGRTISICNRLGTSRLLICESSRNDVYQKILLNISTDDVHYALQASNLI